MKKQVWQVIDREGDGMDEFLEDLFGVWFGFGRGLRSCWILCFFVVAGAGSDGQSQRPRLGSDQGGWNLRQDCWILSW